MINTVHVGIGPIGQKMVKYAVERGCFNIVGAVDPDPDKAGKELGELCGIEPLSACPLGDALRRESLLAVILMMQSKVSWLRWR